MALDFSDILVEVVTMGLDPGYRMGCKVAVVDGTGKVLGSRRRPRPR